MTDSTETTQRPVTPRGPGGLQLFGIVFLSMLLTLVLAFVVIKYYFFPSDFNPVLLSGKEQQVLNSKLRVLGFGELSVGLSEPRREPGMDVKKALAPEAYNELEADRQIVFSERELNALIANNTDMAGRLAIDLSDDLISAKLLMQMDEDLPVMGAQTLKVKAGIGLSYEQDRAVVVLRGVSIMGIPVPNAWLSGLKNIDLVQEFGGQQGFWKAFADGIEALSVEEGHLFIKFKE